MKHKYVSYLILILLAFDIFAPSIVSAYPIHRDQNQCELANQDRAKIDHLLRKVCEIQNNSPYCREIPKEQRKNCHDLQNESQLNLWKDFKACAKGALDSAESILNFIWEILTWIKDNTISSESRAKTTSYIDSYTESIKLYLVAEYQKGLDIVAPPFKTFKAASLMMGVLGDLIISNINNAIESKVASYKCLNQEAKAVMVCKSLGKILVPPAGAIALIKYGPSGLSKIPGLEKYFTPEAFKPKYKTKPMKNKYAGEEHGHYFMTNVEYYANEKSRRQFKVLISPDGLMTDADGNILNIKYGPYVMDGWGEIYAHTYHEKGKFHHSSFLAGGEVASAGFIIVKDGKVKFANRHSGHYTPSKKMFEQFLKELSDKNVNIKEIEIGDVNRHIP
ncbi:MAG: hypothetical protein AB7I27_15835 [Bacteriovoracaceae bacterium]